MSRKAKRILGLQAKGFTSLEIKELLTAIGKEARHQEKTKLTFSKTTKKPKRKE